MRVLSAYHLTHSFGKFSKDRYLTNSPNPSEGDLLYVLSGDNNPEKGMEYFLEGKFQIKRIREENQILTNRTGEKRNYKYEIDLVPLSVPDLPVSMACADWYDKREMHNKFTSGQNFNPLQGNYRERFDLLLAEFGDDRVTALDEDLEQIYTESTDPTERVALIKARLGQGKFKASVIKFWQLGETCALTGISVRELLIASHIRSWRDCVSSRDKLDGANGIILCTQADKLFDRHLLSFKCTQGSWETIISKRIDRTQLKRLGIASGMKLRSEYLSPSKESIVRRYLEEHLTRFNENEG